MVRALLDWPRGQQHRRAALIDAGQFARNASSAMSEAVRAASVTANSAIAALDSEVRDDRLAVLNGESSPP
jgi:hypothetical protein